MGVISKILGRMRGPHFSPTELGDHLPGGVDLLHEYRELFTREFARWDMPADGASWEMRHIGHDVRGTGSVVVMLRLQAWEGESSLRLLLGLPFLERRLRQSLRGHWLADVSRFAGVWLHASEQMLASPNVADLRELLAELSDEPVADTAPPISESGIRELRE